MKRAMTAIKIEDQLKEAIKKFKARLSLAGTVSLGFSTYNPESTTPKLLFEKKADTLLFCRALQLTNIIPDPLFIKTPQGYLLSLQTDTLQKLNSESKRPKLNEVELLLEFKNRYKTALGKSQAGCFGFFRRSHFKQGDLEDVSLQQLLDFADRDAKSRTAKIIADMKTVYPEINDIERQTSCNPSKKK